ncbi:hypothetical protein ACGFY9_04400 [Streptomyces sp. NPDC048504]|uniref:hypothetical protein n=1 Tax=Streptomyces sp. NPDC048504 TaxID=3365559 RepID=UPI0037178C6F
MPLFRRAEWPRDHRDELVAGALVGAVVIVLGYASGIGAPTASGEAAAPAPTPPAATAPPAAASVPADSAPGGSQAQVPGDTGVFPISGGTGAGTGTGVGTGQTGTGHDHGTSPTYGPTPTPTSTSPSPAPSGSPTATPPADGDGCADGEVRLVRPLLTGLTQSLFGVLDGADAEGPTAQPSPCVGLAPLDGLLGATAAPSASPSPEATP